MSDARVRVTNPGNRWLETEYYINDKKIENVKGVHFDVSVDEVPEFTFVMMAMPEIDMSGNIAFSFTPETLQQAAQIIKDEFSKKGDWYNALVSSVQSALSYALAEKSDDFNLWSPATCNGTVKEICDIMAKKLIGLEV